MHALGDIKSATRFAQRFGPIESAQLVDIGGRSALEVLLAAGPGKTRTLRAWTRKIRIADAVIGKFNRRDPKTRLTVRGVLPTGIPVLLVATFDDCTETGTGTGIGTGIGMGSEPGPEWGQDRDWDPGLGSGRHRDRNWDGVGIRTGTGIGMGTRTRIGTQD